MPSSPSLACYHPFSATAPCRQACRYCVIGTFPIVVLALALPTATLPRARRAVASTGRTDRARLARLIHRCLRGIYLII